ncbi:hypothetical protein GCM10023238_28420 [Streptomyces heliomycini]
MAGAAAGSADAGDRAAGAVHGAEDRGDRHPGVCLPKVSTLMRLEQSTLQVLVHPSNSGKDLQVLRIPTMT